MRASTQCVTFWEPRWKTLKPLTWRLSLSLQGFNSCSDNFRLNFCRRWRKRKFRIRKFYRQWLLRQNKRVKIRRRMGHWTREVRVCLFRIDLRYSRCCPRLRLQHRSRWRSLRTDSWKLLTFWRGGRTRLGFRHLLVCATRAVADLCKTIRCWPWIQMPILTSCSSLEHRAGSQW